MRLTLRQAEEYLGTMLNGRYILSPPGATAQQRTFTAYRSKSGFRVSPEDKAPKTWTATEPLPTSAAAAGLRI